MTDTNNIAKACERCDQARIRALDGRLNDPDSDIVREALTRTCDICGAGVATLCHNFIQPGQPLPGRLVHIARTIDRRHE